MKSILDQTLVMELSPWKELSEDADTSKIECSFSIFSKASNSSNYKPLQLDLIGKTIVLTNNKTAFKPKKGCKMIDLDVDVCMLVEISNDNPKYPCGLRIECSGAVKKYYLASQELRDNMVKRIGKYCVQTNFESKYLLQEQLGSGNFGKVYQVEQIETKKKFAAKCFAKDNFVDQEKTVERLLNEIRINRVLTSPSIVQLHEVFESSGKLIFIMDLAHGKNLLEHVKNKPFEEKEAAAIVKKVVEGLLYIHKKNIVHRDIKLENIIYDPLRQETKIIDFGLSCYVANIGSLKKCGTPGYVAPEILRNQDYDHTVDYFSLGVVIYAMLTARSPFGAEETAKILKKNKEAQIRFVRKHWSTKSYEARDLCFRLLQDKPEKRLKSSSILKHEWFWILLPKDKQLGLQSTNPSRKKSDRTEDKKVALQDDSERSRQSLDVMKLEIDPGKSHSDKLNQIRFSNTSKLHKRILKRSIDIFMNVDKSRNMNENQDNTSYVDSNDSVQSVIFTKHTSTKTSNINNSMRSFYLKEQSLGEEFTRLELMSDQKSTSSNNIAVIKAKDESDDIEDSIPEDLEPISLKLRTFRIESPALNTPFSDDPIKSVPLKRIIKSDKELLNDKDSKSKRKSKVSSFSISSQSKESKSFSGLTSRFKSENSKDSHKDQKKTLKPVDEKKTSNSKRKRSEQSEASKLDVSLRRRDSDNLHTRAKHKHKSKDKMDAGNTVQPKTLFSQLSIRDEPMTPSFKPSNQ